MTATEFALAVTEMPAEKQNEFFQNIKELFTEDEYNATLLFITHIGIYRSEEKKAALKTAIREMMVKKYYSNPRKNQLKKE